MAKMPFDDTKMEFWHYLTKLVGIMKQHDQNMVSDCATPYSHHCLNHIRTNKLSMCM